MTQSPCRANRQPAVLREKYSRLRAPHIAPITALVEQLRVERHDQSIPFVDPDLGGVDARILFLFQDPGPKCSPSTGGSGLLSPSNDDPSANTLCLMLHETALQWKDISVWNAVPWYTAGKNAGADRAAGVDVLCRALNLLPRVRVVVTGGRQASESWVRAVQLRPHLGRYVHVATHHPSVRGLTMGSRQPIEVGRARLKAHIAAAKRAAGL